jgi:hypothetical protein
MKIKIGNSRTLTEDRKRALTEATFNSAKALINEEKKTFAMFSTFRGERGYRKNMIVDRKVREFLNTTGYSWTVVEGGYREVPRDEQGEEIPDAERTSEVEKSYLVFEGAGRPDTGIKISQGIFEVVKRACEISDQESFSFGYKRRVSDDFAGESEEMFIAIYPTNAEGPGEAHRIKATWAGPWSSFDKMMEDTGYYTKIRGTKGAFFEEEIKKLEEQISETDNYMQKRSLRYQVKLLRELRSQV